MKTKKIYQVLFPGLSYENEPWMDTIWLSCFVICLGCVAAIVWG